MSTGSTQATWLAVDLDGTLHIGDTSWEGLASLLSSRQRPDGVLSALLVASMRGRAAFKSRLASLHPLPDEYLKLRPEVTSLIAEAKAQGRRVVLATGAPREVAQFVAVRTGLFDEVVSSSPTLNLTGAAKRRALDAFCGVGNWEYVGDSSDDLEVWAASSRAWIAAPRQNVLAAARRRGLNTIPVGEPRPTMLQALLSGMRMHQWAKNLLVLAPPILAHGPAIVSELSLAAIGFVAFSLVASATYLFNDLLDIPSDRNHPTKSARPLASGALSVPVALVSSGVLGLTAISLSLLLPVEFCAVLIGYVVLTVAYSMDLKRRPLVDVVVLASLYIVRLVAGAVASGVVLSFWLLAFALFLFFSLAVAKRATELGRMSPGSSRTVGRGYQSSDLEPLTALGVASGVTAVLVFALYLNDGAAAGLYPHPRALWFVCPILLYWIARVWLYVRRDWIDDDPVAYALRDRTSRVCAITLAAVFVLAVVSW